MSVHQKTKLNELNAVLVDLKLRGEITVNKLKSFRSQYGKIQKEFNDFFLAQHAQRKTLSQN